MFSGIVEEAAPVVALRREQGNLHLISVCGRLYNFQASVR